VLRAPLTRDHRSVIRAVTLEEQLVLRVQERALRGPDVVRFRRHLLRHLPGRLLVRWDGAPIHRGHAVTACLATEAGARIEVEQLPGYAPELNPDAGVWHVLKQVELRNQVHQTVAALGTALRQAAARLRRKPLILRACLLQAGVHP
jgi:transposase